MPDAKQHRKSAHLVSANTGINRENSNQQQHFDLQTSKETVNQLCITSAQATSKTAILIS